MAERVTITRRSLLVGLGLAATGLAVGFSPGRADADEGKIETSDPHAATQPGLTPNAFVHVAPSGEVTIVCHRSEMGQGIRSSLPVLIADELGADMARVKIVQADGDAKYGDQNTDGSASVRTLYEAMRKVGATARVMLVAAAAKRWGVPASACVAEGHAVVHKASKRKLGFGELAEAAAKLPLPKPESVGLRPKGELHHVGGPLLLVDAHAIVTGEAVYGADVKLPGMLVAVIARPPVVGGQAVRHDAKAAFAVPGVKRVIPLPAPTPPYAFQPLGGIAVLADTTWAAMRGRAALDVAWSSGDNGSYDSTTYRDELLGAVRAKGEVVRHTGDVDAALAKAARRLTAEYQVPHLAHAPMEPPVAIAKVEGGRCEIWTSTQNPQAAQKEAARALGIGEDKVTVHVTLLGGAFGRKSKADFVSEAALLAREAKAPVRVQWTREDDVQHDYYHTTSAQRLEAGLDDHGRVTAWLHRTAFPSISSTFRTDVTHPGEGELQQGVLDLPLAVPNVRAEAGEARAHTRIGWLRSVCNIHHAFATGSFTDELAHARGMDPKAGLLDLFGPDRIVTPTELGVPKVPNYGASLDAHPIDVARMRRVIERVTALARWDERGKDGRALGLAAHRSFLTYVAVVVAVSRVGANAAGGAGGKVRVDDVWIVADAGTVINPDRARSQLEGAVVFGMSIALYSQITMKAGATEQTNFRDYRLTRIAEAPRTIVAEVMTSDGPPGGIGEPGVPPIAPAIANAVFALTGTRVRELPLSRAGLV